jgi:hypothetical protein
MVREQEMTCVISVKIRRPQRYEASKPNREGRTANFLSGGEKRFVGESWFAHQKNNKQSCF